jgi:DNA-directed RNA polymerase specialized sigma24 family protein
VNENVSGVAARPREWPDTGRADVAAPTVTELFRSHHLELIRLALLMTGDVATAEDVVQDAFERLHRRWPNLRRHDNGLAYVRSSVLNGCRSLHRRALVARKHAASNALASLTHIRVRVYTTPTMATDRTCCQLLVHRRRQGEPKGSPGPTTGT